MDISKGIGILLVVLGHLPIVGADLRGLTSFIFVFHVPLFFFLSGVFFKEDESCAIFILKKLQSLYVPFVIFNCLFMVIGLTKGLIFHQQPYSLFPYFVNVILGLDTTPLGSPTWFLLALYRASILYKLIVIISNKNIYVSSLLSVVMLAFGMMLPDMYYVGPSFVAVLFYHSGYLFKKSGIKDRLAGCPLWLSVIVMTVLVMLLCVISRANVVDMRTNIYGNWLLFILGSSLGIITTIMASNIIHMVSNVFSGVMAYFGRASLWILALHLFVFQIILLSHGILVRIMTDAFDAPMWFWYTLCFLCGSIVPVLLLYLFKRILNIKLWYRL